MCGEYGEQLERPHFHACLFNFDFPDKVYHARSQSGEDIFTSAMLQGLWSFGFSSCGAVTFQSAAYVARYVMKKVTGMGAAQHYQVVDLDTGELGARAPEFCHMSLKPGIGAAWLDRFQSDVYPHGKVVINGQEAVPPKYYDRRYKRLELEKFEALQFERELVGREHAVDNTVARLRVREQVLQARLGFLKRRI